jgi:hypothetical protein
LPTAKTPRLNLVAAFLLLNIAFRNQPRDALVVKACFAFCRFAFFRLFSLLLTRRLMKTKNVETLSRYLQATGV